MREIQNTSSSFIREMERAADLAEAPRPSVYDPVVPYEPPAPFEPPAPDPAPYDVLHEWQTGSPVGEKLAEPGEALDHGAEPGLHAAEPVPERDHTPHV